MASFASMEIFTSDFFPQSKLIYKQRGGTSVIYQCTGTDGRTYCLKQIDHPSMFPLIFHYTYPISNSTPSAIMQEANTMITMKDCPYVLRLYGYLEEPGKFTLVLDYAENGSLRDILQVCSVKSLFYKILSYNT